MNCDQIQDYLTELSKTPDKDRHREDVEFTRRFLSKLSQDTNYCIHYLQCNYTDIELINPIILQLLALYYKGALLRQYVLQYVPSLIACYLLAVSKKQKKSVVVLETFFTAIYNEEILAAGPGSERLTKKVEEVRIPSIRFPSIYHDPLKINALPDVMTVRPGVTPSIVTTVRTGPYPTVDYMTAETKFVVLTLLMKSVNAGLYYLSSEVVCRCVCLSVLSICHSGFSFPETNFRAKVMDTEFASEVLEDYSKKPRQHVNSCLLLEFLTSVYLALFNGTPELALSAIDAVHQRAQYDILPDVLLVTNSIRNSLLDNPLSKEKRDELLFYTATKKDKKRKDLVTNASLRIRKMPEDIPVQPETKEKEQSRLEELVEEGMDHLHDWKKRVSHTLHKGGKRRKSVEPEDVELQTIREERTASEVLQEEEETEKQSSVGQPVDERKEGESEDEPPKSFTVGGLRHMDSGSSTQRSMDFVELKY